MEHTSSEHCRLCGSETRFLFCQRGAAQARRVLPPLPRLRPDPIGKPLVARRGVHERDQLVRHRRDRAQPPLRRPELRRRLTARRHAGIALRRRRRRARRVRPHDARPRPATFTSATSTRENLFARGFEADPAARFDFVTCFEVFEHFADVAGEMERLFAPRHDARAGQHRPAPRPPRGLVVLRPHATASTSRSTRGRRCGSSPSASATAASRAARTRCSCARGRGQRGEAVAAAEGHPAVARGPEFEVGEVAVGARAEARAAHVDRQRSAAREAPRRGVSA